MNVTNEYSIFLYSINFSIVLKSHKMFKTKTLFNEIPVYFVIIRLQYRYLLVAYVGLMRRLRLGSLTFYNSSSIHLFNVMKIQNVLTFRSHIFIGVKAVWYCSFKRHFLLDLLENRWTRITKDFTSRRAITLWRLVGNNGNTNQQRRVNVVNWYRNNKGCVIRMELFVEMC